MNLGEFVYQPSELTLLVFSDTTWPQGQLLAQVKRVLENGGLEALAPTVLKLFT